MKWKPIELNSIDFKLKETPNPAIYQLLTSDGLLFSLITVESKPTEYLANNAVVECVYLPKKQDSV